MAESKNNIITHGLSGKVGDLIVFSQRNGKTIVSRAPKERVGDYTENQKEHQRKFQKATLYAKSVMKDPDQNQMYSAAADTSKGISTYNVAVADLLKAPDIQSIDLSGYTGEKGDVIRIKVLDDFAVKAVTVTIENEDGSLVEEGSAVDSGFEWIYTATEGNKDFAGDKITIKATDNPANVTEMTQTL
jgi:hypothetical protein